MSWVTLTTIQLRDQKLANLVTQADLDAADAYYTKFALSRGVDSGDIVSDPAIHIFLAESIIFWVFERVAREKVGVNTRAYQNGVEADVYLMKYKMYKQDRKQQDSTLTPEVFKQTDTESVDLVGTSFNIRGGG